MAKRHDISKLAELKIRVPERLRKKIEAAAGANDQSMSAEMVERLTRSFENHDRLTDALATAYGSSAAGLVLLLGQTLVDAGVSSTRKTVSEARNLWLTDSVAYEQAVKAANFILEAARPDGPRTLSEAHTDSGGKRSGPLAASRVMEKTGEMIARENIRFLNSKEVSADRWFDAIRELLGWLTTILKHRERGLAAYHKVETLQENANRVLKEAIKR